MSAPVTLTRESTPSDPDPVPAPRPWGRRVDISVVLLLFTAATFVLIEFRREPVYSDDLGYWNRWERLGQSTGMANHYRLGMIGSVGLARLVFGDSMAAYNAVGIVYGAGLIVALYVLTRLLFPRPVAVGAAVLLLTSPVFLEDATLLLPDWPSMFWFVTGLALFVYAATRLENRRHSAAVAFGAGICFFLAIWIKESSLPLLFAVPICALLVTRAREAIRLTLIAASSAVLFLVVEFSILWMLFGDPFRRLDVILGGHIGRRTSTTLGGQVEPTRGGSGGGGGRGSDRTWADLANRYVERLETVATGQWVITFLALALLVTLIARSRRLWFLAVPTIIGLGFAVFGVGSIQPLVPLLSMKLRYLSIGWVFLMALAVAAVWTLLHWTASKIGPSLDASPRVVHGAAASILLVTVGMVSFSGISDAAERPVFVRSGEDGLLQIATAVDEMRAEGVPLNKVIADGRSLIGLGIQLRADDKYLLDGATSDFSRAEPADLVVVNRKRIGQARQPGSGDALDEDVLVPPPHWRRIGDTGIQDFRIYYVEEPSATAPAPPPLTTSGEVVTTLMRGSLVGDDPGQLVEQLTDDGVLVFIEDAERARLILGDGSHNRGPEGEDAERLTIREPGRFGVRVEFHIGPDVELEAFRLRTFDEAGEQIGNSRMYRVTEDGRVSESGFLAEGEPMSFADSVEVQPGEQLTFRVVGFLNGTGSVTIDRIAVELIPTD